MSNKKKSPKDSLGQGSMEKLSNLEKMMLQDEAVDLPTSQSDSKNEQPQPTLSDEQGLDALANLEGDLLQDSPSELKQESLEDDADSLWDSIAELEVDFLYDEIAVSDKAPVAHDAVNAPAEEQAPALIEAAADEQTPEDIAPVQAVVEETAVLEQNLLFEDQPDLPETDSGSAEPVVAMAPDELLSDTPSPDSVQALEYEILNTTEEITSDVVEEAPISDLIADDQPVDDLGTAIAEAFASEAFDQMVEEETAVVEPSTPEPSEWDALADMEADLFVEESAANSELNDLSDFENDFLHDAEEKTVLTESDAPATSDEAVVEEVEAVEETSEREGADDKEKEKETADLAEDGEATEGDLFEAFFAEAEASELADDVEDDSDTEDLTFIAELEAEDHHFLDDLIASIDTELATAKAADTMMDLAAPAADDNETLIQHVIFLLGNIKCAVPAANIREVGEINYITPVPNVPDWLLGITSLRGDILSLVDLGAFLNLASNEVKESSLGVADVEIMVVQSQQESLGAITTGLIVDEVDDIQDIAMEQVRVPTAAIDNQLGAYMRGVYEEDGQMIILLDLERLLMSPEMWQFEAI